MYSLEDRIRAVELYIMYNKSYPLVKDKIGYPDSSSTIRLWYSEYEESKTLHKSYNRIPKYTEEQKQHAIDYYYENGRCISRTIRALGYPNRTLLKNWLIEAHPEEFPSCSKSTFMVKLTEEQKEQTISDSCSRSEPVKEISVKYGIDTYSPYIGKRQLLSERSQTQMTKIKKNVLSESQQIEKLIKEISALSAEKEDLEKQVYRLQLEKDVLQVAAEVIKKDRGISLDTLTNREKAIVIDVLRNTYSLKELLEVLNFSKSSYCYQRNVLKSPDKYEDIRKQLRYAFNESYESYGYRRMRLCVKKPDGSNFSEKVIRRLMKEENLNVKHVKKRKYNSYKGEITPAVKNLIKRKFHSKKPNKKWLTDITEFRIPAGKVYLSPIIDCYDGLPVSWTIGTSPNAELVNTMLDEAYATLGKNERPIVHSDRGVHYRWKEWIERMEKYGLKRSMSKKGCSPDNSACEGFFGRLKNEMFYGRSWTGVTIDEFIKILDQYIHWYAEKRIKISLGGLSPLQYRQAHAVIV